MQIWVDADACPTVIREIICRAAIRTKVQATFVANHHFALTRSPFINLLQVEQGFDKADQTIAERINPGDLLISSDIPLADEVLSKGALVMTSRGERYTKNNIKSKLNIRDFMDTMRASGVQQSGGPAAMSQSDRQNFANELDRLLTQNLKGRRAT